VCANYITNEKRNNSKIVGTSPINSCQIKISIDNYNQNVDFILVILLGTYMATLILGQNIFLLF